MVCKYVSVFVIFFMSVGKLSKGIFLGMGVGESFASANRVVLIFSARSAFYKFLFV